MSAAIKSLAGAQIGVVIWCHGEGCTRLTTYVPHEEILAKFGDVTCEQAERKVRCTTCGTHGRGGKIQIWPSTLDIGDLNHGRPSGTTERRMAERAAASALIEAQEKARYAT